MALMYLNAKFPPPSDHSEILCGINLNVLPGFMEEVKVFFCSKKGNGDYNVQLGISRNLVNTFDR